MTQGTHERTRRAAQVAGLTLLVLAAAGACSGGGDPGAAAIDACTLIEPAQAGRILRTTITVKPVNTAAAGPGAASLCQYHAPDMGDSFLVIAGRRSYRDAATQMARRKQEILDSMPAGMAKPTLVDVPGLGEAATLARSDGYFQLHVLANGKVLVINRNHAADEKAVKQVEELARLALLKF